MIRHLTKEEREEEILSSNNYYNDLEFLARYKSGNDTEFMKEHLKIKVKQSSARKLFSILLHDINVLDDNYEKRILVTDEINSKAMISYKKCYDDLVELYPINDYPEYYV